MFKKMQNKTTDFHTNSQGNCFNAKKKQKICKKNAISNYSTQRAVNLSGPAIKNSPNWC